MAAYLSQVAVSGPHVACRLPLSEVAEEFEQALDFRGHVPVRFEDLGGVPHAHLGAEDQPVRLVERLDPRGADPLALQADDVDAAHPRGVAVDEHVPRDVVDDPRLAPDEGRHMSKPRISYFPLDKMDADMQREMENSRPILVRLGITSVIGGGLGAWLLILTPSATFAYLVPFLILFATALFTLQVPITRWLGTGAPAERPRARWWTGAIIFQFFSSIYGGYFGAGNGILMLAAMGLLGLSDIHRANGIKNFLGICINFIAIIAFIIAGLVFWPDALLMAVGAISGGYFGASTARRLGRVFVRRAVVLIGLTIGAVMLWRLRG